MNWDNLRVLLAVARAGTFAGAARRLDMDETTVARRLAALRGSVGAPIIEGSVGARRPTTAGTELVTIAEEMERRLASAGEALADERDRAVGPVRVTAVPMLVNHVLIPNLQGLRTAHPGITPHFVSTAETMSVLSHDTDIALRFGAPGREADAIARRVATIRYGLYGRDADGPWLTYGGRLTELPHGAASAALVGNEPPAATLDDGDGMAAAVAAGLGKGLLPRCVGRRLDGVAEYPLSAPPVTRPLWLVLHPDGRHLARVRAVAEWASGLFADEEDDTNQ